MNMQSKRQHALCIQLLCAINYPTTINREQFVCLSVCMLKPINNISQVARYFTIQQLKCISYPSLNII